MTPTSKTYKIQYLGTDNKWHFETDGQYAIQVARLKDAEKEAKKAKTLRGAKTRILIISYETKIIPFCDRIFRQE
jgi:hypothetical protein